MRLERLCNARRFRHLFPGGPSLALLLDAYQDLQRQRLVGRIAPDDLRGARSYLRKQLRRRVREEAVERSLRLTYRIPVARPRPLRAELPPIVEKALEAVDDDVEPRVRAHVLGRVDGDIPGPDVDPRLHHGFGQLREALVFHALAHPDEIGALHPQILRFAASPQPLRRQNPLLRFLLIKLPISFVLGFLGFFSVVYVVAYFFVNDATLGRILTVVIDKQVNGRLELGSVHWGPDLIIDLITGQPHHATVTGIKLWAGYMKQDKADPDSLIAECDGPVDAELILHEIIPWNRFLVPAVLEVPWVLHFTDIWTDAPMRLNVSEVKTRYADGTEAWIVDLVEAFSPGVGPYPELSTRALSIRIDHTDLADLALDLDFRGQTGWQTELALKDVGAVLVFEGLHPKKPPPLKKPLQFDLNALATTGIARITALGYELPIENLKLEEFASGGDGPLGDIRIRAEGEIGGSHGILRGWLRDIFTTGKRSVDVIALFADAGPIGRLITRVHGLADPMIDAFGAPAQLAFRGPFNDIRIGLAASGVGLNFFTDPNVDWAIKDAAIDATLARDPVPDTWSQYIPAGEERWILDIARFEGHVLGGRVHLREHEARNHLVLGVGPERRMLLAAQTQLQDIDPGELVAAGGTRAMLAGTASGKLDVREFALDLGAPAPTTSEEGPVPSDTPADVTYALAPESPPAKKTGKTRPKTRGAAAEPVADVLAGAAEAAAPPEEKSPLDRIVLEIGGLKIERRRGNDGLPRRIRLDGGVVLDRDDGLDLADLLVTVDGATLSVDGGLDAKFATLKPTDIKLKISDGKAFFASIGQSPFVERLQAGLTVYGPLGRPSGRNGSLQLSDVGQGQFAVQNIRDVSLGLHDGVLSLKSQRATVLGGAGVLDVDVGLFDGKGVSSDPTLRATIDLTGVELDRIGGDSIGGKGDVRLEIGDDAKRPVPLSKFQARGAVSVPELKVGHGQLRDTETRFSLTRDGVSIDEFVARQHRRPSPSAAPDLSIPVGDLSGKGSVSFDSDPQLDLRITGRRLPISTFAAIAGFTDLPAGAQIDRGTDLEITGTLSRPSIHGTVELTAINAVGIPLGSGELQLDSNDRPAGDGLAARREIVVKGRFGDDGGRRRRAPYEWDVDAVVAIGEKPRGSKSPSYAADLAVHFANLPLRNLLGAAGIEPGEGLHGQAEGLTISARTCPPGQPMITSCLWGDGQGDRALQILVELDRLWATGRAPSSGVGAGSNQPGDPCRDSDSLCTANRLVATLQGTRLSLRDGWELRSGGSTTGKTLTVSGDFELSGSPEAPVKDTTRDCSEPPTAARTPPPTGASARVAGELDLAGLHPFLAGTAVSGIAGKIGLDVKLDGHVGDPIITGSFSVPDPRQPVTAKAAGTTFAVPKLSLQWAQDALLASGELSVRGQNVQFGDLNGHRTFYVLGGECGGSFSAAARGRLDGRLFREFLPDTFASSSGGLQIADAHVAGRLGDSLDLKTVRARVTPAPGGLMVELDGLGLEAIDVDQGVIEIQRCSESDPCPASKDGFGVFVGGRSASIDELTPPEGHLRARVGDRGSLVSWGNVVLAPDFSRFESSSLRVDVEDVQYKMFDNSGRPQLYAAISGESIVLEGRDVQTLRGDVQVARGRWVRDAQQGVKVLSFADPSPAPSAPPPEILRDMNLDLRLRTTTPFRVDNNIMKGVEGQVSLAIGGTIADLEMSGRVDVTAGVLDVALLNGAYDITFGRVLLENNLSSSKVDVRAQRQEPVYIDNQPRQMSLILGGTLDAITFRCSVLGDTRARSRTQRECVDYAILGSGNREVADANVRRYGSGGLLGRPLGLVGNLTEINLNRYVEKSVPRLAPYLPQVGAQLGQLGVEVNAETPRPWFRTDWGNLTIGAGYTRGYPGLLLRNSYDWRVRFRLLDSAVLEFRDNRRSYFNERIIFDPLRQRSLELRLEYQLPSLR
ncbi:translocation/assembly module TamB domain-containing protein [Nannocystis punicea]|uniref:Translocation and assembly module TamB C-terminal domain-containing protein n=1 Tax=Nannocystis punicea TaxID=2995304 RepID=A0ABY7GSL9_9BACT|nr:translocation/assembly module TamB domain-containing protein [Nannocystis poenicansa]WAS89932.1 hypothetical protein O0S08_27380 [Nannocystis poenicansa]